VDASIIEAVTREPEIKPVQTSIQGAARAK
jgi:hypothetical protein